MSRLDRLLRAMSPASLLVSILALLIASSSISAYAATKIGTAGIRDNAIVSRKIDDGTVNTRDLAKNAVRSNKILDGSIGPEDLGFDTLDGVTTMRDTISINAGERGSKIVNCPAGSIAMAGGFSAVTAENNTAVPSDKVHVSASTQGDPEEWFFAFKNNESVTVHTTLKLLCIST